MKSFTSFLTLSALLATALQTVSCQSFSNQIYLIRHGEKPSDGGNGLSSQGEQRAQCVKNLFGSSSNYNIGYIIAEHPKSDGSRERPYETVEPLAQSLGLTVDTSCSKEDTQCAHDAIANYAENNSGNVLVCWEHEELGEIGASLGGSFDYPDGSYDLIYEIVQGSLTDNSPYSEDCPGLDN